MDPVEPQRTELPARLRRALDLVYAVEGVVSARLWHWPGRVAVGISLATTAPHAETLRRVEHAVAPIRQADETWDFGLLESAGA